MYQRCLDENSTTASNGFFKINWAIKVFNLILVKKGLRKFPMDTFTSLFRIHSKSFKWPQKLCLVTVGYHSTEFEGPAARKLLKKNWHINGPSTNQPIFQNCHMTPSSDFSTLIVWRQDLKFHERQTNIFFYIEKRVVGPK